MTALGFNLNFRNLNDLDLWYQICGHIWCQFSVLIILLLSPKNCFIYAAAKLAYKLLGDKRSIVNYRTIHCPAGTQSMPLPWAVPKVFTRFSHWSRKSNLRLSEIRPSGDT